VKQYTGETSFDLSQIGEECVFWGWFGDEAAWCRAASDYAGAAT